MYVNICMYVGFIPPLLSLIPIPLPLDPFFPVGPPPTLLLLEAADLEKMEQEPEEVGTVDKQNLSVGLVVGKKWCAPVGARGQGAGRKNQPPLKCGACTRRSSASGFHSFCENRKEDLGSYGVCAKIVILDP